MGCVLDLFSSKSVRANRAAMASSSLAHSRRTPRPLSTQSASPFSVLASFAELAAEHNRLSLPEEALRILDSGKQHRSSPAPPPLRLTRAHATAAVTPPPFPHISGKCACNGAAFACTRPSRPPPCRVARLHGQRGGRCRRIAQSKCTTHKLCGIASPRCGIAFLRPAFTGLPPPP